jgi:chromosome segregation ATPase
VTEHEKLGEQAREL